MDNTELILLKAGTILNNISNLIIRPIKEGTDGPALVIALYGQLFRHLFYGITGISIFLFGIGRHFKERYFNTESYSINRINIGLMIAGGMLSAPLNIALLFKTIETKFPTTAKKIMLMKNKASEAEKWNLIINDLKKMYPVLNSLSLSKKKEEIVII